MIMKKFLTIILLGVFSVVLYGQNEPVHPSSIKTATHFNVSKPLSELPPLTAEQMEQMKERALKKAKNKGLGDRVWPYADNTRQNVPDGVWQKEMGKTPGTKAPILNFAGQSSTFTPPDVCGDVGPNHYFQTVNSTSNDH